MSYRLEGTVLLDEIITSTQIQPADLELRFTVESTVDLPESAIRLIERAEAQLTRRGLDQWFCPRSVVFQLPDRVVQISAAELTLQLHPTLKV